MYLEHYGLSEKPFGLNPDPAYLYLSSQHSIAYHMLEYGLLSQAGITVVSGEIGAGKTTLLRHLLEQHDAQDLVVGFLADTEEETAEQLLSWVAMAFQLDHSGSRIDLKQRFQEYLIANYGAGKTTVLIVDEAQNLGEKALEQLRLLNNINTGQDELLNIILVGQPDLLDKLRSPKLVQFAQRVTSEYHLGPLRAEDALGYIQHRLKVAGSKTPIFDKPAMYALYYLAGGVPRLLNTLCDHALVWGFSTGSQSIGVEGIVAVASGRMIGGVNTHPDFVDDMSIAAEEVQRSSGVDIHSLVENARR